MKNAKGFLLSLLLTLTPIALTAAPEIDMNHPLRALGREDDVRIDAQLMTETVSSGVPIGIIYQVQNLTKLPIAVAEKQCGASYDAETRTITVAIGSEVPVAGAMPRMAVIKPGEKKTFTVGASFRVPTPSVRSPFITIPRYVQIKVSVLRDVAPFVALIDAQGQNPAAVELTDDQFDRWLESNETIFLNELPVRFEARPTNSFSDVAERTAAFGLR